MVLDGGKLFRQSLASIKGFDAQLCVLIDNRTTDDSAEIARAAGAEVEFHDWPDDFGEARNRSLRMGERKWTLVIDHDERYEPADIPRTIEVLETEEDYEGIRIQTLNELPGGTTAQFIPRFIKTGRGRYIGAKHHALIIAGNIRYAPGRIYHTGYNLSPAKMQAKNERDIKLLLKQIEEEPHETYHRRNLIRSLRSKGDLEELLKQAQELDALVQNFQVPITDLSQQLVMLDAGSAYMKAGEYEDAEVIFSQLATEYPANPDAWFYLGCVQHNQEKYTEAVTSLEKYISAIYALRTSSNPPNTIVETWASTQRAYTIMAAACLESSQWEKYKQAQMAAYMQMNQEFITSFSSKEVTKIRNLETELAELKEPSPKLITL
jgi:tetratricopeptide (TPR) repeat protein